MPSSNIAIAPNVLWLIESASPHRRILDIGPGHGKYRVLVEEFLTHPPDRMDACEAWAPYVYDFRLHRLYDAIHVCSAQDLSDATLAEYDLILMVDVLEHMPKDQALAFLDRCPGWVVICTPVDYFHNGHGLPPTEDHVSHWTAEDWAAMDRVDDCTTAIGGWLVRLRPKG